MIPITDEEFDALFDTHGSKIIYGFTNNYDVYVHRWHTPIKVMVSGVVENWYYAPSYNPRHVPVVMPCARS